ncbi:uncharacterized protein kif16bb isoform X3 [Nerophis ophidion]|uniref:uncharacterized protein kif16bb isoform X3 n=1 Tax=Nerophis ophidion TaxID=159077 RepID=UPI002ADF28A4|nr:uncharacterized protein kif16bb isoform X3 [Nerophis ophidion]
MVTGVLIGCWCVQGHIDAHFPHRRLQTPFSVMASVLVAVRVRPLNKREKQLSSKEVTHLDGNTIFLYKTSFSRGCEKKNTKIFSYDFSYDSTDKGKPSFASQEMIFNDLGHDVLKAACEGFNACVFAYGQTGSGKSYTMMGHTEEKGLIPRICEGLFSKIAERSMLDHHVSFRTEVSFMEIYNERVHDLLQKKSMATDGGGLRVREHPRDGPYVEHLSKHSVHSYRNMEELIALGNAKRITASTGMNDCSSRSHAIFTINFTQAWFDAELPREMLSKIHLVDLAGSERADAVRTSGVRLKEGANINKSLVTLGTVISALADLSAVERTSKKQKIFIPYRDSVLTWLLKDSLGGNSKTTMIATISPADLHYAETLSTLRYASRARNIVNSPTVNEDSSVKLIRELQSEVTRLKNLLEGTKLVSHKQLSSSLKVEEELHQNEEKIYTLTKEWTCRWEETHSLLEEEAVAVKKEGSAVVLDCQLPHLIGIDEDLLSTGISLFYLKEGKTLVNPNKASCGLDVAVGKPKLGCVFENHAGIVTLIPQEGAACAVNRTVVTHPCQLTQGAIIQLGSRTLLRFNHPTGAVDLREKQEAVRISRISLSPKWKSKIPSNTTLAAPRTKESKPVTCSPDYPITEIPGTCPVPQTGFNLGGDEQKGASTGGDLEQETVRCHKSQPERMSEHPWREAENAAEVEYCRRKEVWSGDASLQHTSVLGLVDGCVTKPEGKANEIQGVVAHCYRGRPGSGGSSLGNVYHLQHSGSDSAMSSPRQASTSQLKEHALGNQGACPPPEETILEGKPGRGDMTGFAHCKDAAKESVGSAVQGSRLSGLVNKVSCIVQDAGYFLWNSSMVLRPFEEKRQKPFAAYWSNHLISLARKSKVMSVIDSQVFSLVRDSYVFSRFKGSHMYSMIKYLPLMQNIHMDITGHLCGSETTVIIHDYNRQNPLQLPVLSQTNDITKIKSIPDSLQELTQNDLQTNTTTENLHLLAEDTDVYLTQEEASTEITHAPTDLDETFESSVSGPEREVQRFFLMSLKYPDPLVNLQNLSLRDLRTSIQLVLSSALLDSHKIVALFWLNVAKCSQPEPCPALLVLSEVGLYTLTAESGPLVAFHQLPFLQLKELQVSLAGYGLRLVGTTEESILGVYTHSQLLTKELCSAILGVLYPGDSRVSQHPVFNGDWWPLGTGLSFDRQACVPDLLLDADFRVCWQFQKSLAELLYLLHCNMEEELVIILGEVQLLMYTSVKIQISPSSDTEVLAQLLLTDTHLGVVQEDVVFHPPPRSVSVRPCHPQFRNLSLRQRSDVRCMLVHDEDECGAVGLDLILSNVRAGGHPDSVTKVAAHAFNLSPHAEMWKLTFLCSTEATCLINHLSSA